MDCNTDIIPMISPENIALPRRPFEIIRLLGKVSNFKKENDGFSLRLNDFPHPMQFFFEPPAWLVDGAEICIWMKGGDVKIGESLRLEVDYSLDLESMGIAVEGFKADLKALMSKYGFAVTDETGYKGSEEEPFIVNRIAIEGKPWNIESFHEIITDAFGVICLPEQ